MPITNMFNLPAPLVDAVTREYTPKENQFSVTTILKSTREILLSRRHDSEIYQDVSEMIWLIFGTAVHKVLEDAKETESQLKENKIVIENVIQGYNLSGIFDLYDDATGEVVDYKTASVNKVLFNDWDDYRKQTLIYCYMLRKIGFNANKGKILAFLKDWTASGILTKEGYPKTAVYVKEWKFNDRDFRDIEADLIMRFSLLAKYKEIGDNYLPACTDEECWYKGDSFAVIKGTNKKATKVCSSEVLAQEYINKLEDSKNYHIVKRIGEYTKCKNYCKCNKFCNLYKERVLKNGNNEEV